MSEQENNIQDNTILQTDGDDNETNSMSKKLTRLDKKNVGIPSPKIIKGGI